MTAAERAAIFTPVYMEHLLSNTAGCGEYESETATKAATYAFLLQFFTRMSWRHLCISMHLEGIV